MLRGNGNGSGGPNSGYGWDPGGACGQMVSGASITLPMHGSSRGPGSEGGDEAWAEVSYGVHQDPRDDRSLSARVPALPFGEAACPACPTAGAPPRRCRAHDTGAGS